jgi:tripartite ATP-independent transporter DctM subunit
MSILMTFVFALMLVLGAPVGYVLVLSGTAAVFFLGDMSITVVLLKIFQPMQSFPLLAIPFFVMSGALLMSGDLGRTLIRFAASVVGRFPGGLGQVNVFGSAMFGGVSGSAVADASALGSMLIPWMKKEGYPAPLAGAICSSASIIAVLIPPSIPLILFAAVSNESIATLFMAGVLPGLMLTGGLMTLCYVIGRRRNLPVVEIEGGIKVVLQSFLAAAPAVFLPVGIFVLLRGGIATPTEVSVLAVAYGLAVRLVIYRDLTLTALYKCILGTLVTTGIVMLVISASNLVGFILTVEEIPTRLAEWALSTLKDPWKIILLMNAVMLVSGMFIDLPAAMLLLAPMFIALANAIGLDLIQLGLIMTLNLAIGLFTPPVGTTLFISSAIAREPVGAVVSELWPFYAVSFGILALISYIPAFTLHF